MVATVRPFKSQSLQKDPAWSFPALACSRTREQAEDIVSYLHMPRYTHCTTGLVGSCFPKTMPAQLIHLPTNIMCFNGIVCLYVQAEILFSECQAREMIPLHVSNNVCLNIGLFSLIACWA